MSVAAMPFPRSFRALAASASSTLRGRPPLRPLAAAAASLAGTPGTEKGETLIALTVDTDGIHRRRVWEAWEIGTGRTTRWGALVGIGATVRAAGLDHLEPYRQPRPMEVKQVRHGIGIRQVAFDPEDDELVTLASG